MARKRVSVFLADSTIEKLERLRGVHDQNLSGVIRSIIMEWLQTSAVKGLAPLDAGRALPPDAYVGREAHRQGEGG